MQSNNILITGGSGFLGSHLIELLKSDGLSVKVLSRSPSKANSFAWDLESKTMDATAFQDTGTIIHLAGAGIAEKKWTTAYKKEIVDSRVESLKLLFNTLKKNDHQVKRLISASAIGIYGDTGDTWVEEDFHSSDTFMSETCRKWEEAAMQFEQIGVRVVCLRIGLVLGKESGVLPALAKPIKLFLGAPLGRGRQYMSWIHIDDLCRMFLFAVQNDTIHGVYNAVSPGPVTQEVFIRMAAKILHRPVWPFPVPSFIMKLLLGERACLVLEGQRVSSEKIRMAGFNYLHSDLQKTLTEFLS